MRFSDDSYVSASEPLVSYRRQSYQNGSISASSKSHLAAMASTGRCMNRYELGGRCSALELIERAAAELGARRFTPTAMTKQSCLSAAFGLAILEKRV